MSNVIAHIMHALPNDNLAFISTLNAGWARGMPALASDNINIGEPLYAVVSVAQADYDDWYTTHHSNDVYVLYSVETNGSIHTGRPDAIRGSVIASAYSNADEVVDAATVSAASTWVTTTFPTYASSINGVIGAAYRAAWSRRRLTRLQAALAADGMQVLPYTLDVQFDAFIVGAELSFGL